MRFIILKYGIVFSLVIMSGVMLMDVSHRVQRAERDVRKVERHINREQENIRVLRAEWAYLNAPARLERLATQGLGLSVPDVDALISDLPSSAPDDLSATSPLYIETSLVSGGGAQ
tara:strand:+ start:395 stop:742 length:348 start_codon:yes stop_codon:yes gene_type:complete